MGLARMRLAAPRGPSDPTPFSRNLPISICVLGVGSLLTHDHEAAQMTIRKCGVTMIPAFLTLTAGFVSAAGQDIGPPGQEAIVEAGATATRTLPFVRIDGELPLSEEALTGPAWQSAPVARDFVQWRPDEGAPPSQATEARVLFGREALYVAIRAWDSAPDSIEGLLTRRDEPSPSDWLVVLVDSYHDRRTGFLFMVNPVGVKRDALLYDDIDEDEGWQAVWDVAVNRDEDGWTAEFRIPYSQLRFGRHGESSWGINFGREIARHQEMSTWAPLSQNDARIVSRSGIVEGIRDLEPPRRIELKPYSVVQLQRTPGDPADPFHEGTVLGGDLGGDVKVGIGSNLTMDVAVNPDFGQVEADPGRVNLTAFETFFPERRPFFLEGANIFRFGIGLGDGDDGNETLFHSRRIGRSPQGSVSGDPEWVDRPDQTRILAAGKFSGRTGRGWSVGILSALTAREDARISTGEGLVLNQVLEPRTNYVMGRVQRDENEGRTAVGTVFTATVRNATHARELALRSRGYAGGVDFSHRFHDDGFLLRGYLLGSRVEGSVEAIRRTQESPARYYQRPDADHLRFDEARTSLMGHSGGLEVVKVGGGPWRGGVGTRWRSPGFEVNDLGFMNTADHFKQLLFVGYHSNRPGTHLRRWSVNANAWSEWTFGGERTEYGNEVNGSFELTNGWGGWGGINVNASVLDPRLLRGGPAMRREERIGGWFGFYTDSRRDIRLNGTTRGGVRPESDSWSLNTRVDLLWRPSPGTLVRLGPFVNRNVDDRQWVGEVGEKGEAHYLFGRLDQTTVGLDLRAELALAPTLSVQLYAQPFMSAGTHDAFKTVDAPRARGYEERFRHVEVRELDGGGYGADLMEDRNVVPFDDPDFNTGRFRSNLVFRWEYRPGSTLFLVWSHGRDHSRGSGTFHLGEDLDALFSQAADHRFMVKLNRWLSP